VFSIFILYSKDRLDELITTIFCLQEMNHYGDCQKMLVVDGETNIRPYEFEVLEVERPNEFYCWAKMWDEAIAVSEFDNILYIDSDRILPTNYLDLLIEQIDDNSILFPKRLFSLNEKVSTSKVREIRENPLAYSDMLIPDHRITTTGPVRRKNPISGCTALTRSAFERSGGLDYLFEGWGCPDLDYFHKLESMDFEFKEIDCTELHLKHDYADGVLTFRLMNLWNGIKYCRKWGVPIHPEFLMVADEIGANVDFAEESTLREFIAGEGKSPLKFL